MAGRWQWQKDAEGVLLLVCSLVGSLLLCTSTGTSTAYTGLFSAAVAALLAESTLNLKLDQNLKTLPHSISGTSVLFLVTLFGIHPIPSALLILSAETCHRVCIQQNRRTFLRPCSVVGCVSRSPVGAARRPLIKAIFYVDKAGCSILIQVIFTASEIWSTRCMATCDVHTVNL